MMPYDSYRSYQAERAKSPREIHDADQRAAQLASIVPGLFRAITQNARRPHLAAPGGASPQTAPAASRGHDGRGDGGLVKPLTPPPAHRPAARAQA